MLVCSCGFCLTHVHTKSQRFIDTFHLMISEDGNEAVVECPVCHEEIENGAPPHWRENTDVELQNPDILPGLENCVYPYTAVDEGVSYQPQLPNVPKFRLRLVPGSGKMFGKIEMYDEVNPFDDPLGDSTHIPIIGERIDQINPNLIGAGSLNGSLLAAVHKAYLADEIERLSTLPPDYNMDDLI